LVSGKSFPEKIDPSKGNFDRKLSQNGRTRGDGGGQSTFQHNLGGGVGGGGGWGGWVFVGLGGWGAQNKKRGGQERNLKNAAKKKKKREVNPPSEKKGRKPAQPNQGRQRVSSRDRKRRCRQALP